MSEMRIDPGFDAILAGLAALPPACERTLDDLRYGWDYSVFGEPEPVAEIGDHVVPVGDTGIAARLYRPENPSALMVYYHGGGWTMGGLESHDRALRIFANRAGIAILSVDYRLAPEHPFPTALEDSRAGLHWAHANAASLRCDGLPFLVGGDSAGGNLAAAVALSARNGTPALGGQLLIYPALDGRCDSGSYASRADCTLLTARDMRWYWSQYVPEAGRRDDPMASPCRAEDHAGTPPAIIAVAGFDPLRDEALDYAAMLARAGTQVTLLHYPDLPHGFFSFHALVPAADRAFGDLAAQVRRLLGSTA